MDDRQNLPQEVIEAKKTAPVLELEGESRTYYFKKPGKADISRYLASAAKGKLTQAVQNMVFELAVHPAKAELQNEFEERPGLLVALNNALQNAVGINEEFNVKKL